MREKLVEGLFEFDQEWDTTFWVPRLWEGKVRAVAVEEGLK